jgi:hypothetical protein
MQWPTAIVLNDIDHSTKTAEQSPWYTTVTPL